MFVSSALELYLALFSWHLYSVFWDIGVETGLAYLPFIGVLFRNFFEPQRSQEAKDASGTSLRRMELDLFVIFTVIVLATQPLIPISYSGMNFTRACTSSGAAASTTGSAGSTGTTYDTIFTSANLGGATQHIPIWWAAVNALSNGFNNAAILGIPCTADIRLMRYTVNNTPIKDARTRSQIQLFFNDCYFPALGEYLDRQDIHTTQMNSEDLNWVGSDYLLNTVYPKYRAKKPVYGFSYDRDRDLEWSESNPPLDGKPTCAQWWTGQGHFANQGLRQQILSQMETTALTVLQTNVSAATSQTSADIDDIIIRTLINREEGTFKGLRNLEAYTDKNLQGAVTHTAGQFGAWLESVTFYPRMHMVKAASPIIQAVVLMLLVILLPFIIVFSSFKISTIIFMSIVFFAVRFWTVLWAIAHWLDNNLLAALSPGWFNFDKPGTLVADDIIGFVTAMLYIVMPLFWLGALSWVGFRVGGAISDVSKPLNQQAGNAGQTGGNTAKLAANKGINKLK
jgi:hypothetical protein